MFPKKLNFFFNQWIGLEMLQLFLFKQTGENQSVLKANSCQFVDFVVTVLAVQRMNKFDELGLVAFKPHFQYESPTKKRNLGGLHTLNRGRVIICCLHRDKRVTFSYALEAEFPTKKNTDKHLLAFHLLAVPTNIT